MLNFFYLLNFPILCCVCLCGLLFECGGTHAERVQKGVECIRGFGSANPAVHSDLKLCDYVRRVRPTLG